ncbi:MAG: HlyD family efflux transporter periplasmic adaptor subunit, partial [Waterburya sp.]
IIGTGIIVPWSVVTKVDETGTARGRLEPKNQVIHLDAPVAGKIEAINVKEGDTVKKGAILAEIDSEVANSELAQLQEKISGLQQRLSQLELMKTQSLTTLDTKEEETQSRLLEKQSQVEQAQQNFNTLKALYESQKGEKQAQIEQAQQEINSSIAARKQAEVALRGAQEKARRYELAYKQGVIAQDRFFDVQQQAQENRESLAQASSAVEQAKSRLEEQENSYQNLIKQSQAEIEQAALRLEEQQRSDQTLASSGKLEQLQTAEGIQEVESQITEIKSEIAQTEKQIQSSKFELKQRELIAPNDGTVFHIPARGKGAVVQPGERMIEIAPQDSTLILKAQIPPTDSGFLKKGMPVKIKFDAYPFKDYGISEGTLISISPDSKVAETTQGQEDNYYELKVELDKPYILDQGKRIELTPGQTATAEIIVRQRRVIDFFLDPFRKLEEDGMKL